MDLMFYNKISPDQAVKLCESALAKWSANRKKALAERTEEIVAHINQRRERSNRWRRRFRRQPLDMMTLEEGERLMDEAKPAHWASFGDDVTIWEHEKGEVMNQGRAWFERMENLYNNARAMKSEVYVEAALMKVLLQWSSAKA